ncbi:MAG: methyltransferase domain-containing protein [Desulfuromonadales bacterium]|nr:methyltransferase domain-containing protein [Desulfuromonadales bacterium]
MHRGDERNRIGRGFHRHAGEYDQHAVVQKRVVANLTRLVATHSPAAPRHALDIGCGTGAMLTTVHGLYPGTQLCGLDLAFNMAQRSAERLGPAAMLVNGDAECLPFRTGAFDLVVSASTLQWVQRLDSCFQECWRVLAPGGLLCAAFFGGKTLWELQESYREALADRFSTDDSRGGRLQRFRGSDDVRQALSELGFDQVVVATEREIEHHPDVAALLRSIKGIGATTPARNDGGGLGWRGLLNAMASHYRSRFQKDGMIPATYDVIYLVARRSMAA